MSPKSWNEVDLILRGHHEPMSSAATRMANALRERAMQNDVMNEEDGEPINAAATSRTPTAQSLLMNALAAAQTLLSGLSGLAAEDESQPGSQVAFSDEM